MTRQIETHHYVTRLNQDFLQCAVYDFDDSHDRLINVEYIVSDKIFELLFPDEQKLWHSHAYEIKASIWVNPQIPEMIGQPELQNLAKNYGTSTCGLMVWEVICAEHGIDATRRYQGDNELQLKTRQIRVLRPDFPMG
ncbi:oil body-associated protein 2B-like [Malus domestica]|uniref:oil body-associated protein 2B-like n=1 Tax=Malus domestica TaxID=3750 RepID=UPI003974F347